MPDQSSGSTLDLDAILHRADMVVSTSVIGRPRIDSEYTPKVTAKVRLDPEVIDWLKAMGPRHFSRVNAILTVLMEAEKEAQNNPNNLQSEL